MEKTETWFGHNAALDHCSEGVTEGATLQPFGVCVSFAFHLPDKCVISEVPANQERAKELRRFDESYARQRFGTEGSVVRIHSPRPIKRGPFR